MLREWRNAVKLRRLRYPRPVPRVAPLVTRPPTPKPPPSWRDVRDAYKRIGTIAGTARWLGTGYGAVQGALERHGVPLRKPAGTRRPGQRGLYNTWRRLIRRCTDPDHPSFSRFGGRGIGFHRTWSEFRQFREWSFAHGWAPGKSLILIDVDRDHGPRNCRWEASHRSARLRRSGPRPAIRGVGANALDPLTNTWRRLRSNEIREKRTKRGWPSFDAFRMWARAQGFQHGMALVRLDPSKGYGSTNCRFVPRSEVGRYTRTRENTRISRFRIRAFGDAKGPTEWARDPRCRVSLNTLLRRLRAGVRAEAAITDPPQARGSIKHHATLITAFGESQSVRQWARDARCKVTAAGLRERLKRGITPEEAITTPTWSAVKLRRGSSSPR